MQLLNLGFQIVSINFILKSFGNIFVLRLGFKKIRENIDIMINQKVNVLDNKIDKLIDTLAWWIPIRKWRDNFRNKLFDKFIE